MITKSKKVLIISYYWPPCGGIGVLRCLKFAKFLSELGWEPIVYTAKDAHYPNIDHSNKKDIPANATILKGKIWEPYHIYKFLTRQKKDANINNVFYTKEKKAGVSHRFSVWVRSNFFIPDARAMWIAPSVKFLSNYLKDNPVDAIISDGPPHSNTRIATILKKETGIPWLADFQDPWSQVDYFKMLKLTSWGRRKHLRMEQEAFKYADRTTIVSPTWKKDLEAIGAKNVSVIYYGYDLDDYNKIANTVDQNFTITHLGILGHDRNPSTLLKVIKEIGETNVGFKNDFRLQLVGQVDISVQEEIKKLGLEFCVQFMGSVDRQKALEIMSSSNILLLLLNQQSNAKGRIPGKIFEYFAVRRPVIVLGPNNSDSSDMVIETKSGVACEYEDKEQIKQILLSYYEQYKSGTLKNKVASNIEPYSVRKQVEKIDQLLKEIILQKDNNSNISV